MRVRGWGIAAVVWLCACTLTTIQADTVSQVSLLAGAGPLSEDLTLDLGEDLQTDVVEAGDIAGVSLAALSITSTTPGVDISFLDRVDVYIEAAGLPRVRIATGTDFAPGARTVQLEALDVALSDYLLADDLYVYGSVSGVQPPADVDLDLHVTVDVAVTPQGACNALNGLDTASPEDTGGAPVRGL